MGRRDRIKAKAEVCAAWLIAAAALQAQFLVLSPEPTAADIAAQSVEAMGGAAQFALIDSLKIRGRMRFGQDAFTPFTVTARRPNRFRLELTAGSDHVVQAYDGTTGWQSVSGPHDQPPTVLAGESLARLIDRAANAIGGPLVDLEKRGNRAAYVGREAVNGVDCFKLNLTLGTGDRMVVFIDSSTFREIQEELPIRIDGQPATIQQSVGNYRRFGPIWVACLFVTRQKGREDSQRVEIDSVELNPPIEERLFEMSRSNGAN